MHTSLTSVLRWKPRNCCDWKSWGSHELRSREYHMSCWESIWLKLLHRKVWPQGELLLSWGWNEVTVKCDPRGRCCKFYATCRSLKRIQALRAMAIMLRFNLIHVSACERLHIRLRLKLVHVAENVEGQPLLVLNHKCIEINQAT